MWQQESFTGRKSSQVSELLRILRIRRKSRKGSHLRIQSGSRADKKSEKKKDMKNGTRRRNFPAADAVFTYVQKEHASGRLQNAYLSLSSRSSSHKNRYPGYAPSSGWPWSRPGLCRGRRGRSRSGRIFPPGLRSGRCSPGLWIYRNRR